MPEISFPYGKTHLTLEIPEDRYAGTLVSHMHEYTPKASPDQLVLEAMAYQISKSIGENAIALKGKVDAIILTGGLARSKFLVEKIEEYAGFLAPVYLYPGEYEMIALAKGAYRALSGQEPAKTYDPAPFPAPDDLARGQGQSQSQN